MNARLLTALVVVAAVIVPGCGCYEICNNAYVECIQQPGGQGKSCSEDRDDCERSCRGPDR